MITVHSYGDLIMRAWGWTWNANPNAALLAAPGGKRVASTGYAVVAEGDTTGTTGDFAYGDPGVASYTFEIGSGSAVARVPAGALVRGQPGPAEEQGSVPDRGEGGEGPLRG
ncbi:hypothetical protein [Saccharothrix yanglingensis]|uniref:hypothetical protein n=1 Tax=Saccharothrix yanglingensis TaxID=659496 RepID=UPI0027D343C3|nr:hypothetical protein [Saccharothrix yanglingensis]